MQSFMNSVPQIKNSVMTTVTAGSKAVLNCTSNDYNHNFMLWLNNHNKVISPGSNYDERKYKYEVLSGKLFIDNVTPSEAGQYVCISKSVGGYGYIANEIHMTVDGSAFTPVDAVKLVAIIVSLIVIICSGVLYFRLKKDWNRYDGRSVVAVHDDDEEGEGDEIYNSTTTSISQPVPGPSRNHSSDQLLYGIDNQGLDTDFNSVFENIQIKSPERSLI